MRPTLMAETLKSLIREGINVHIEGSPGLGKTQITQQVVEELGFAFIQKHAPTLQPEDLALPASSADKTRLNFLAADWLPLTGDAGPERTVILIDELPQADNAIQKAVANIIQEKECHGHKLRSGVSFISTGNRVTDRAGANRLLSHLSSRMTRIDFDVHLDDWCSWALDNDVDPIVISYLRFKPGQLNDPNPQADIYPTPRAWAERVSPILDKVPPEALFDVVKGAVGEGATAEFIGFRNLYLKLPNPDVVLMHPDTSEVPEGLDTLYALSGAIAHRATHDNFDRVMTYAKRLPPEFCVLVVRDATKKDKTLQHHKAFTSWAVKEGAKVLM